jgi:hypothetical protein
VTSDFKIRQTKSAIAFLATGIGVLALAIVNFITDITGGNPGPVGKAITIYPGIGPYSGKQTIAICFWLASWYIMYKLLGAKELDVRKVFVGTVILYVVSTLLIFPPFLDLFD